jgi:hypothetical protein
MFIGHYAVALGAKKAAPRASLGTLLLAAQFLDLLWPVLLLVGIEHVRIAPGNTAFTPLDFYDYPISHSLVTSIGWGVAFALVYWWFKRNVSTSFVLAACVFSHWVLDFVTHRPDLPIAPGMDRYVGLGLWNSVPASIAVELAIFAIGLVMFLSVSKAKDRSGRIGFWTFIAFLMVVYAGNIFGGPPPSVKAVAWAGMSQWLMVLWAYWLDRHRMANAAQRARTTNV